MARMSRELIEAGLAWRYTPARMASLIRDHETVALVACKGSRVQGFAVMQFGEEHAHLSLLCVRPACQRQGIGRCLIEWLVESARVAGIVSIRLELRVDNAAALGLYRSMGFAETRLEPGYYDGQMAARRMMRALRASAT